MKIIKYLILFILIIGHFVVKSETVYENDSIRLDSTNVKYFVKDFNNLTLGNDVFWDTTTLLSSIYNSLENPYKIYQTLSNSGLAHKDINFTIPYNLGFNSELQAFSSYLHNINNIKFPIVLQPFTDITYMSGDNKEQHLEILFCREFLPRFFVTLNYDIDFSPGVYKRTKSQNSFFNGNFRYNTKNERYGINGCYFYDKIDIQENGGIVYDSVFINNLENDKSIIDVNITNATNLIKTSGFTLDQYFNILGPYVKKNYQDSIQKKHKIGVGRINHHFSYQRNKYVYEDSRPLSYFYQKFDPIIDSTKTFDSICFYNIKNVIHWNTLGYRKYTNDIPFYLTLGLEHNYTHHAGYLDLVTKERFNERNYSNLRVNAGIIINLFKSSRITGNAQIITTGYHAGDFFIEGQWKQFLGTYKKNIGALKFDINLNRQSADWFEEYYYSNNFRWDNDFKPSTSLLLHCSYELPFLEIGVKSTNIDNYIYFGTDAKPQQYSKNINVNSLYTIFCVNFNKLEFVGFASLQTTNNDKVIHIPTFQGKIKLAYNINLVKNISMMQPSITVNYFTKYYADAYMPALRTFYLQNEVEVGNFPYIDLCVTFKIKKANIFVQYTNMYSLTKDNRYFTTPHYPMRDSRFCFGVNWRLYK
ncbi:MAG: hypothetical protein J6U85_05510 [Bacteroidales bacterium]|nr:hypothetical protein [bacterium]MBO7287673.1 hypothetical protein [Bacteroidales bacterium]